nr:glycosyltransferase [Pseudoalteromonas sp. KAN5]
MFSDDEHKKLCSLIEQFQLAEHITFVGYSDCVEEYYKAADIFVLSSAWEGFGNVIVEAMSFGLPVIATNCNYGPSEILESGRYGRLVDVGDYQGFAKAVEDEVGCTLVAPELLISRSQHFSETNIAREYHQLIREVVHG